MGQKIAIIGDIHGCLDELRTLLNLIDQTGVTQIFHLGDLVDRGPDAGGVVSLLRQRGIMGVRGNHESKLLDLRRRQVSPHTIHLDQLRRARSLDQDPANWDYLESLPRLHVLDHFLPGPLVLVHGGLWPRLPLWKQPFAVMMAQLIDPEKPGAVAWSNDALARAHGYMPWWEVWDGEETVVFGHTVFPEVHEYGTTIGLDTGCVFGGKLSAIIMPDRIFVQVKAAWPYAVRDVAPLDEDWEDAGGTKKNM